MSDPNPLTDPDLHNQALGMIRDTCCVKVKYDDPFMFVAPGFFIEMSPEAARAIDANRRRKKPKPQ